MGDPTVAAYGFRESLKRIPNAFVGKRLIQLDKCGRVNHIGVQDDGKFAFSHEEKFVIKIPGQPSQILSWLIASGEYMLVNKAGTDRNRCSTWARPSACGRSEPLDAGIEMNR